MIPLIRPFVRPWAGRLPSPHARPLSNSTIRWSSAQAIKPVTSPANSTDPISDDLRQLMRRLTHSVVVCTTSLPTKNGIVPRAMTMSSFTSLALAPRPLVTFNIKAPSATLDAVVASRRFNIHVLDGSEQGARVAEWFTRGNHAVDAFEGVEKLGEKWRVNFSESEPPILSGEGILSRVTCQLLDSSEGVEKGIVRISDHVIIIGEVIGVDGVDSNNFALTYADRAYRTSGDVIQRHVMPNNKV